MTVWIVREGANDEYLEDCFANSQIAIAWKQMKGKIAPDSYSQEDLNVCLEDSYPDETSASRAAYLAIINNFCRDIAGGDWVLVPSGKGRSISVAYVVSKVLEGLEETPYFATRKVVWLAKELDREKALSKLENTSAIENPRTVVRTKVESHDLIDFLSYDVGVDVWKSLLESRVNSWVFQSNPTRWNLIEALKNRINTDWAANQNREKMRAGDLIFFRQSEPNSGVYAFGHLRKEPEFRGENQYGQFGVEVSFDYRIEEPLLKGEIASVDFLKGISQINGLQGSNFAINSESTEQLLRYLAKRFKPIRNKESSVSYWWCNVGVTRKAVKSTGFLWAHAKSKSGAELQHHSDMNKIKTGDKILLYHEGKVVAVATCTKESVDGKRPSEYPAQISSSEDDHDVPGFLVEVSVKEIEHPVSLSQLQQKLRESETSTGPLKTNGNVKLGYLFPLSEEFGSYFVRTHLVRDEGEIMVSTTSNKDIQQLAQSLCIPEVWIRETIEQLQSSKQLILYGPPGTGKTYLANAISEYFAGQDNVITIQFHPAYSYEDFFEGFRPQQSSNQEIRIIKADGPLKRLSRRAHANPDKKFVLIIDEINRGNLAKIFGELYYLLEYRNKEINLMYSPDEKFSLPGNLYIIGTMNTSDRSIALVDNAIRRRFHFVSFNPNEEPCYSLLEKWLQNNKLPDTAARLLKKLNSQLNEYELSVGPAYFMKDKVQDTQSLERTWKYSIVPLLEEYFYGDWLQRKEDFDFSTFISKV